MTNFKSVIAGISIVSSRLKGPDALGKNAREFYPLLRSIRKDGDSVLGNIISFKRVRYTYI